MKRTIKNLSLLILTAVATNSNAQITPSQDIMGRENTSNIIQTASSYMLIAPDSRSGALGDAGVATSPDIYSQHWNASKYVFAENKSGISFSYTPWLRNFVDDMNMAYLSGYSKLKNQKSAIGYSLEYFTYGNLNFYDENGSPLKDYKPNEFNMDVSYSMKLSDHLSGGLTMRYLYSNLTGGLTLHSEETHAGHSVAGDLSIYYSKEKQIGSKYNTWAFGINISNIGAKMSYSPNNQNFIPTNLKIGASYKLDLDEYNSITLTTDFNKLLVPTPPIYNATGDSIISGKKNEVSVPVGIFQSFYDAPGGFSEEMKEITLSIGLEYWYSKTFAGRMGYFTESNDKGGRKFMTFGVGLNIKAFEFDFSYMVTTTQSNPLQNTIRISLGIYLDKLKK